MCKSILFILILSSTTFAQVNISNCALKLGYINNLNIGVEKNYNTYYEIGTGGQFFYKFIQWSINIGYWNDNINKIALMDCPTFSNRSIIVGLRYHLLFNKLLKDFIPLDLFSGINRNFIHAKYIGGSYGTGRNSKTHNKYLDIAEIGLGGTINLYHSFNMRIESQRYIPLSKIDYLLDYSKKYSVKLGLMYVFK